MTDPSPNHLNFGHFGTANYDLDNSEWAFSRDPFRKKLNLLGPWRITSSVATQCLTPSLLRPARNVQQAARELARDYAHIAPAVEQLPELETISAAATSATASYDATSGCLLSFGSITCRGHSDHRPKFIVATPVGEVGNILQLQVVEKERHGWDDLQASDRGVCLEGPSLTSGDPGYWNEDAAPIRQICFAEGDERSTFLAVRFPNRTVVFHPTYVHKAKVANHSKYFDLPPSRIDPSPIHSISVEDTGGIPHADVSFNAEYQRQLGVVNEQGHWFIWDIDDGYRADNYKLTCSVVGSISQTDVESEPSAQSSQTKEDGWARILWCGDANTVVVANRRRVCVFNVKGGLTTLKSPRVIPERSADWILDVRRHPSNKNHFFLLTSTRLFLVAVTCPSDDPEFAHVEPAAAVLLSWTHYRGIDDITLQLCVHIASEQDCIVLLHSHLNALVTVYHFENQKSGNSPRWSSSDPTMLSIEGFNNLDESNRVLQLHLDNFDYKERGYQESRQGRTYRDHDVRFYNLTAVSSDLSIRQVILYNLPKTSTRSISLVAPTSWVRTIKRSQCQWKGLVDDSEADVDFVRADGVVNAIEPHLKRLYQPPTLIRRQALRSSRHSFDFGSLYEALHEIGAPLTGGETVKTETVDVAVVAQEAERLLLGEITLAEPPLGTLLEFAGMRIMVSDVDEASTKMLELYPNAARQLSLKLHNIASGHVLRLTDSAAADSPVIASLYDVILQNWIAPLTSDIPVPVRQSKERLARQMAAEIILASTRIRRIEEPHQQLNSQPSQNQISGVALSNPSSQLPFSDPPSQLPSSLLSSLQRTTGQPASATVTSDPLSRLSIHLHIESPLAKPVPASISQILSHWQPDTDPKTYSWEATEEALQEEAEVDPARQDKKRESTKRKKERKEKRQKREDDIFMTTFDQPQMMRTSPGPFLGTGIGLGMSSQIPGTSQYQSQSQVFGGLGGMGVQSQVEPGRHGGRLRLKKKKGKKRVGGF